MPDDDREQIRADLNVVQDIIYGLTPLAPERRNKILRTVNAFFLGGEPEITGVRSLSAPEVFFEVRPPSVAEYINSATTQSLVDEVILAANYLKQYENIRAFNNDEIYRLLGFRASATSIRSALGRAADKGLLALTSDGAKQLTPAGRLEVKRLTSQRGSDHVGSARSDRVRRDPK